MVFAHDTEVALASAAALVNTLGVHDSTDRLTSVDDVDDFVRTWDFTGSRTHDEAELQAVRELRHELLRLWTCADVDVVAEGANHLLASAAALPQLVRHDGWGWHLHATTPDRPLATRMAVEAAMALVDVVRSDELGRLRVCAADDCEDVHVDLSRNRSRRFCGPTCGNRTNVAAYRARRSGAARPA
ncbi:CGNR zinc finger domain-containing protein [Actinotalea sp. Marseille-Q4924]|uniref:CGNR zinc finger domain-containing protein n=1 Tax=Actinotalea sp. Marseille-Q4924 TaxID=2866571 RepID=UPI001CE3EF4E|nr:CGNR zinc finger domain-containing protein [Actinotalea sp. Marseille-Q4924]